MTSAVAESDRSVLDEAWGRIPHTRESQADQGTFTQTRIERVITLIVGPGSLVLGAQAFFAAFGPGMRRRGGTSRWCSGCSSPSSR